jgi:hypothetical protein
VRWKISPFGAAVALTVLGSPCAQATDLLGADEGKLLLTAGFSDLEGAGGGGLVPLALIGGYGSDGSWGASAHFTTIVLRDFQLQAYGAAAGLFDRIELGYTRQRLDVTGTALDGLGVRQDVYTLKVRLLGNAVYDQDSWLPQIALGADYQHNDGIKEGAAVGAPGLVSPTQAPINARAEHAADYYLAATKIFLSQSLVLNAVVRATKANQFGLLGFGGDRKGGYSLEPEAMAAYLLTRQLAVGGEFRAGPHNLSVDAQSDAWDIFGAWTPTKNISLVAAYLDLGGILGPATGVTHHQAGPYLSLQLGF